MTVKRIRSPRNFFDPSTSPKTTYVEQLKSESQKVLHAATGGLHHVKRQKTTREFFDPSTSPKTTYVDQLKVESEKVYNGVPVVVDDTLGSRLSDDKLDVLVRNDSYLKDEAGEKYCGIKKLINTFISSHSKKYHQCLVLDGSKARTTKELLKVGVDHIDIPNDSEAYDDLVKFSKRTNGVISVHPMSLGDFLERNYNKTYNIIYMDTCGSYDNCPGRDIESCLDIMSNAQLDDDDVLVGITITSRCPGGKTSWKRCENHVKEAFGLRKCWEIEYGLMKTMFFKR